MNGVVELFYAVYLCKGLFKYLYITLLYTVHCTQWIAELRIGNWTNAKIKQLKAI